MVSGNTTPGSGLAIIRDDPHGQHGHTKTCSCGWKTWHPREKIREDRVDRHITKRHGGKGIRL